MCSVLQKRPNFFFHVQVYLTPLNYFQGVSTRKMACTHISYEIVIFRNNIMSCLASKFSMDSLVDGAEKNNKQKQQKQPKQQNKCAFFFLCIHSPGSAQSRWTEQWFSMALCVLRILIEFIFQSRNLIHAKYMDKRARCRQQHIPYAYIDIIISCPLFATQTLSVPSQKTTCYKINILFRKTIYTIHISGHRDTPFENWYWSGF